MRNELFSVLPAREHLIPPPHTKTIAKTLAAFALTLAVACLPATAQVGGSYQVTNLVSDGSVPATVTNTNFINPWAISDSGTWWIATEASGMDFVVSTVPAISFSVVVPAASGSPTAIGVPAGSVTTGGTTGMLLSNGTKASFLFSTLDGTIAGWNSKLGQGGAISLVAINNTTAGASYPGLAIINTATASYILAPNFGTGNKIEIYDGTFKATTLPGTFTDPTLPAGYSPFSVHVLGTQVFVAYALRSATAPYHTINAVGNGVVSVFDTSGNFVARVATGGNLDSPWGVAIAPANFGIFGGDILIGNFGNGIINAYDPHTYAWRGQLNDNAGHPLAYASLWELLPGGTTVGNSTGFSGGDTSTVYFTAGLANEAHGLFAAIANNPTPTASPTFGFSASTGGVTVTNGSAATATLAVAPTNNFTGTVTLACASGVPAVSTCSFNPATVNVTATTSGYSTLTIQTTKPTASLAPNKLWHSAAAEITSALLLPFGCVLAFRRRRANPGNPLRLLGVLAIMIGTAGFLTGCSSNYNTQITPSTPTGTTNLVITATAGSVTQATALTVTVQ